MRYLFTFSFPVGPLLAVVSFLAGCTSGESESAGGATGGTSAALGIGGTSAASGGAASGTGGATPGSGGATTSAGTGGTSNVILGTGGDAPSTGGLQSDSGGTESGGSPSGGTWSGSGSSGGTGGDQALGGTESGGTASGGDAATAGSGGTAAAGGQTVVTGGGGGASGSVSSGGTETGGIIDREQAPYPEADPEDCGAWALVDNVCCAQYCSDDNMSEACTECGVDSETCVTVNSKACKSGKWPEVHALAADEPWHYSRSTWFGFTASGACAYGLYSLCTTEVDFDSDLQAKCDAFCTAYPDLCADPEGVTLRGNYAAPQGNYYSQFWPSLPGDLDNYLSCGECFELIRVRPDGTEYAPGDDGYTLPVVLQVNDSCPCAANSKWCCGSGRDHCGEVDDFAYGCPLPPGPPDPPADHDPLPNESVHFDLSPIAMSRLQTGDPTGSVLDGVIPTKYRRVPCPVVGNTYIWLHPNGGAYWFSLSVVNSAGLGSVMSVEAQLPSGEWVALGRDANYTSSRPQERYGSWVLPQGVGPFELPVSIRLTSPSGEAIIAEGVIKSWEPADPAQEETYYIDTGVQFE